MTLLSLGFDELAAEGRDREFGSTGSLVSNSKYLLLYVSPYVFLL